MDEHAALREFAGAISVEIAFHPNRFRLQRNWRLAVRAAQRHRAMIGRRHFLKTLAADKSGAARDKDFHFIFGSQPTPAVIQGELTSLPTFNFFSGIFSTSRRAKEPLPRGVAA